MQAMLHGSTPVGDKPATYAPPYLVLGEANDLDGGGDEPAAKAAE